MTCGHRSVRDFASDAMNSTYLEFAVSAIAKYQAERPLGPRDYTALHHGKEYLMRALADEEFAAALPAGQRHGIISDVSSAIDDVMNKRQADNDGLALARMLLGKAHARLLDRIDARTSPVRNS